MPSHIYPNDSAAGHDDDKTVRPLKILYLHQYFATPRSNGGTRSYEFGRRIVDRGHEVRMVTSPAYMPKEFQGLKKTCRTKEFSGIDTVILPIPYNNQMSFAARIWAFIKFAFMSSMESFRYKPDVIFATSAPLTIIIPALIAKMRWRKPLVFEVRDLWPEAPIAAGALTNPILIKAARVMEWVAYHSARHVVVLSEDMADGVKRRNIKEKRITVIPNSSDTALFDVPAERGKIVRDKLNLSEDDRLVVYTGTFGIVNEVTYLVEVAATMRDISSRVHFLLVGGGKLKQKAIDLARELGVLGSNLSIWDPVPKTELPDILSAASISTSTVQNNEGLWPNSANKIFDAMAAGRPIGINHGGWQSRLIAETGCGVVMEPGDPSRGAQQLAEFLLDDDRLAEASRMARELGRDRFNRDRLAQIFHQVLVDAAG